MHFARSLRLFLLFSLLGAITIALQAYVGDATIYAASLDARRLELHEAILHNVAPGGGSWGDVGAASLNLRVGIVYLAEAGARLGHLPVLDVYRLLDTLWLFVGLVGVYAYLRKWLPDTYCLIGTLYLAALLPLTYFLHAFQPWDRIQLCFWLLMLHLLHTRRTVWLGLCLAASIVVKFDAILLPALYFLVHADRQSWLRTGIATALLFTVGAAVYLGLQGLYPAPLDGSRFTLEVIAARLDLNIAHFRAMHIKYPPLLMHSLPLLLALAGIWRRERMLWASVLFALGMGLVWLLTTRYAEVRAQLPFVVLVLPAALLTLRELLEPGAAALPAPRRALSGQRLPG